MATATIWAASERKGGQLKESGIKACVCEDGNACAGVGTLRTNAAGKVTSVICGNQQGLEVPAAKLKKPGSCPKRTAHS